MSRVDSLPSTEIEKLFAPSPQHPSRGRAAALALRGSVHCVLLGALLLVSGRSLGQQTVTTAPTAATPATEALRPALDRVSEALAGLNVGRWKAPGEVRAVTQRDVDSIQRDLSATLPPLMDRARAQPASVIPRFAVYRNVDALYDVLLRVAETANLAAPQVEAASLQSCLSGLESARRDLGDAILKIADTQEKEVASLRAAVADAAAREAAAKPVEPTKTVVDDGPAQPPKSQAPARRRKKPVPNSPPASALPPAPPPSQ